jgi:hypothetical protein
MARGTFASPRAGSSGWLAASLRYRYGFALVFAAASALEGQGKSPRVNLIRPDNVAAGTGVVQTTITGLLTEGNRLELLHSGWPTVVHARLQLWRKGWLGTFDRESEFEWDVIVEYSPATKLYHLRRVIDNRAYDLGDEVASADAAEQLLRKPFSPPLSPERSGGRYFYLFNVEVSTMSLTDMDAWQRWMRGEAGPAVRGQKNPGTAIQRGLGTIFSRMLGGDSQSYETKSTPFTAG